MAVGSLREEVTSLLQELIRIDTVNPPGNETAAAELLRDYLQGSGVACRLIGKVPERANLVARLPGGDGPSLLFLSHTDVVLADPAEWSVPPFSGELRDSMVWGRGALDMKGQAAASAVAIASLAREGFRPRGDLIFAATADEEMGSDPDFGLSWLCREHPEAVRTEFAINEGGGGSMRKGKYLTNEVQASEKVYQDFHLEVTNPGGHSSLPIKDNAIYHLSAGLTRLAAYEFPLELNEVTRGYFARSAEVESDPKLAADMRAVAKATPDAAAAARLSASLPYYNALMRTTCVATKLLGGHALNALPQMASANVNCRILPGVSPASVKAKLVEVLADPRITVAFVDEAHPSKPSPLRPDVMNLVESLTKQMYPGAVVVPVMSTGATDGLYMRNGEIPTYGIEGTFADMDDVRAHGKDERVGVKQYFEGLEFHYRLIKALAKK